MTGLSSSGSATLAGMATQIKKDYCRCPDKRSKRSAPLNFAARLGAKSVLPRHGGPDGAKLDRKLLYSRFKPVKSFRAGGEDRENNVFTCTAFSGGDGQFILAGTSMGDLKMFNILSGEDPSYCLSYLYLRGAKNAICTVVYWN